MRQINSTRFYGSKIYSLAAWKKECKNFYDYCSLSNSLKRCLAIYVFTFNVQGQSIKNSVIRPNHAS